MHPVPDPSADSLHQRTTAAQPQAPLAGATTPELNAGGEPCEAAGAELSGRYRRARLHATGGMGQVWEARDDRLGRVVALKELQPRWRDQEQMRRRFLAEARVTGKLEHPGIVPVYDLVEQDGMTCYTMRLIRGRTLGEAAAEYHRKAAAKQASVVELRDLLSAFVGVCNTLAYSHSRGVIHRDLKPQNIILGPYGEVLVLDWGAAKVLGEGEPDAGSVMQQPEGVEATRAGGLMGTVAYMPPEQAEGQVHLVDRRSDVFGLGAVLYEVLTGQPPYCGEGLLEQARTGKPESPRQVNKRVPAALEAVCLKALARRAEDRYQSARELADEVKRWLSGEPVTAWPEPWAERAGRWVRRHRVLSAATGSALVVVLVLGVAGGVYWQEQRGRAREQAEAGLAQAVELRGRHQWRDAGEMLKQSSAWVDRAGDGDLRQRLRQAEADLQLVRDLDSVRLDLSTRVGANAQRYYRRDRYQGVLAAYGLDVVQGDPDELAEAIRGSSVRGLIVAALDDWAVTVEEDDRKRRLLDLANRADEPDPWRQEARQAIIAKDERRLRELASRAEEGKLTPYSALLLESSLGKPRGLRPEGFEDKEASRLLRRIAEEHPGEYYVILRLGWRLLMQKKYQEAVAYFTAAAALRPDSGAARQLMAAALGGAGELEGAARCFRKAIELDSEGGRAHNAFGAFLHDEARDVDGAVLQFRKAIEIGPTDAIHHYNLGIALRTKKDYSGAIRSIQQAAELDPKYPEAHDRLCELLKQTGRAKEAISHLQRAIDHLPNDATLQTSLGTALEEKKDFQGAVRCYRKAVELEPKSVTALCDLGQILHNQRIDTEEAFRCFQKAISLDPDHVPTLVNLGVTLSHRGDAEGALRSYKRAIELDPRHFWGQYNLGVQLRNRGDFTGAARCLQQATEIDPKSARAHYELGLALREMKDREGAIRAYTKVVEIDPKNARAFNSLGWALREKGDTTRAISCFESAIALSPMWGLAHNNLGRALLDKGDAEGAIRSCRKAIDLDRKLTAPHYNIGYASLQLGRLHEAQQSFRRVVELAPATDPDHKDAARELNRIPRRLESEARLTAFLAGKGAPDDPVAQASMAWLAAQPYNQFHLAAARLFRDALARDPNSAEDLSSWNRYNGACSAVLAGCGAGKDAGQLDEAGRSRWRQQALRWLRADLALHRKQLEAGDPAAVKYARGRLDHWRRDADFVSVRDMAALAKLPADEQAAWGKLWAEVDALLVAK